MSAAPFDLPAIHRLRVLREGGVKWVHAHTDGAGPALPAPLVAAIGSFDGVHRGHRAVIEAAGRKSQASGHELGVISFDPHPQAFFRPESAPFALMDLEQKRRALGALGVRHLILLQFDAEMAGLAPADFCVRILKEALGLSFISAGFDFTFGARGQGKAQDLTLLGAEFGFEAEILPPQLDADGQKLSSSAVRDALQSGDPVHAAEVLGRPQAYRGEVITGAQKGRTIGFPTLNMSLGAYLRPRYGVYVTRTHLSDGRAFGGVSNIGLRPTVDGATERLETHLFDFAEDIYGQTVEVELIAFLRPEQKFASFDALKAQILNDADAARSHFPI